MSFVATTSGIAGEDVRDLMVAAVEHRFGRLNRLPVGRNEAHGLPIAAVEGKGHAHAPAVVAADLQAVRAPAGVARVHGDAPLVPALLAAGVALEQEPMHLHDAVDPLHVRGGPALPLGLATQESMNPSIAV